MWCQNKTHHFPTERTPLQFSKVRENHGVPPQIRAYLLDELCVNESGGDFPPGFKTDPPPFVRTWRCHTRPASQRDEYVTWICTQCSGGERDQFWWLRRPRSFLLKINNNRRRMTGTNGECRSRGRRSIGSYGRPRRRLIDNFCIANHHSVFNLRFVRCGRNSDGATNICGDRFYGNFN